MLKWRSPKHIQFSFSYTLKFLYDLDFQYFGVFDLFSNFCCFNNLVYLLYGKNGEKKRI